MDVYENLKKHNLEVPQMLAPKALSSCKSDRKFALSVRTGQHRERNPALRPRRHRCDG